MSKWVMITLIPQKGKERVAKEMIEGVKSRISNIEIFSGGERTEHYHILCKRNEWDNLRMEKWPGIIKSTDITESQAKLAKTKARIALSSGNRAEAFQLLRGHILFRAKREL